MMSSLFGFNVDGFSLVIPDGVSDVSDIDKCDMRISFSRDLPEISRADTGPPTDHVDKNTTVVSMDGECDNAVLPVPVDDLVTDDGDWVYSSVRLPAGARLYIRNGKRSVLATAVIANKCIRILDALRAPDVVGKEFFSPNDAAAAALGYKAANGWNFWCVEKKRVSGRVLYVRLASLRKTNKGDR